MSRVVYSFSIRCPSLNSKRKRKRTGEGERERERTREGERERERERGRKSASKVRAFSFQLLWRENKFSVALPSLAESDQLFSVFSLRRLFLLLLLLPLVLHFLPSSADTDFKDKDERLETSDSKQSVKKQQQMVSTTKKTTLS